MICLVEFIIIIIHFSVWILRESVRSRPRALIEGREEREVDKMSDVSTLSRSRRFIAMVLTRRRIKQVLGRGVQ